MACCDTNKKEFVLVRFEDDVFYVCEQNRLNNIQGAECTAKYTDGGRYPARIVARNTDKSILIGLKKTMEQSSIEDVADEKENEKVPKSRKKKKKEKTLESVDPPQNLPGTGSKSEVQGVKKAVKGKGKQEVSETREKKKEKKLGVHSTNTGNSEVQQARKLMEEKENEEVPASRKKKKTLGSVDSLPLVIPRGQLDSSACTGDPEIHEGEKRMNEKVIPKVFGQCELVQEESNVTSTTITHVAHVVTSSDCAQSNAETIPHSGNGQNTVEEKQEMAPVEDDTQLDLAEQVTAKPGLNTTYVTSTALCRSPSDSACNKADTAQSPSRNGPIDDEIQKKVSPGEQHKLGDEYQHEDLSFGGSNDSSPPTISVLMSETLLTEILTGIEQKELTESSPLIVDQSSDHFAAGTAQMNYSQDLNINKTGDKSFDSLKNIMDIAADITVEATISCDEDTIRKACEQPMLFSTPNETEVTEEYADSVDSVKSASSNDSVRSAPRSGSRVNSPLSATYSRVPETEETSEDSAQGLRKVNEPVSAALEFDENFAGYDSSYVVSGCKEKTTKCVIDGNSSINRNESESEEISGRPQDSFQNPEHSNDSDQSSSGSDYVPSTNGSEKGSENDSDDGNDINESRTQKRTSTRKSGQNSSLEVSLSANEPGKSTRDDAQMFVTPASGKKGLDRRSYCMYCQKMQSKFVRHLENKHKDVDEVKKFLVLPKGNSERLAIIDTIRKKCMFDFNTNNAVNDGELMVCRRPNKKAPKKATNYKVCQNCKGFFSKDNIRHHAKRCFGFNGKKNRTLSVLGRKILGRIHEIASDVLRKEIFPVLREDDIVRLIRYDRLVILYGNKLSAKYGGLQHQHDMIRSHLRHLGRFLMALKDLNSDVTDFASVYQPKFYDDAVLAINQIAGFDPKTKTYQSPSTAYLIGALLKKVANLFISDCIKRDDLTQKTKTEDFLKLLNEDIAVSVNKNVTESQTLQKRRKKVELPSETDIQLLHNYLKDQRTSAFTALESGFDPSEWMKLAEATLISIQLFNRRRAGEIERVFIEDFQAYEGIKADELKKLSKESREIANNYVRFTIRGKLNRTVPVLLTLDLLRCIEKILQHRTEAKVPSRNRYVFGIPGTDPMRNSYLRACALMRKFAKESGVSFPHKLTGTTLRKHIATNCINLNLSENEVADVAKFMGHADKIHRDHYRQPIVSREILRMSKVLELAQGGNADDDNESDSESDDDDENDLVMAQTTRQVTFDNKKRGSDIHKRSSNAATAQVASRKRSRTKQSGKTSGKAAPAEKSDSEGSESDNPIRPLKSGNQRKKKRSTSPYGPVGTKKRWSTEDKELVHQIFESYFKTRTFPSLSTIKKACQKYPSLRAREPAVIKTWISNQYKK